MIPFEELVRALERYKRRQAGQPVEAQEPANRPPSGGRYSAAEQSSEIQLDDVETE
jgi:hypothetical protein